MGWFSQKQEVVDPRKTRFVIILAKHFMDSCEFEMIQSLATTREQAHREGAALAHWNTQSFQRCHYTIIAILDDAPTP
jgi:hypothetical protein